MRVLPPESLSLESAGGVPLRCLRWRPEGPPRGEVVLVHGLGEHVGRYESVARALAREGWGVRGCDLPGHGDSGGRRGDVPSFEAFLETVDRVWGSLPDSGRPRVLVGHSMGGLIALRWAQTRGGGRGGPDALVLSAPWLGTAVALGPVTRAARWLLERLAPGFAVPQPIPSEALTSDPELQEAHRRDPRIVKRVSPRLVGEVERAQREALAEGPGVRTLLISPGADPLTDQTLARNWARSREGAVEVLEVPESRHEPFNEVSRAETLSAMAHWISTSGP